MSYFRVVLHGEDICIKPEDRGALKLGSGVSTSPIVGFYTTRIVEAKDEAGAVEGAILLTLDELQSLAFDKTNLGRSPRFSIKVIARLNFWQFLRARPRRGFTFYCEDQDAPEAGAL